MSSLRRRRKRCEQNKKVKQDTQKKQTKTHLQTTGETTTRSHCLFAKMVSRRVTLSHDVLWLPLSFSGEFGWSNRKVRNKNMISNQHVHLVNGTAHGQLCWVCFLGRLGGVGERCRRPERRPLRRNKRKQRKQRRRLIRTVSLVPFCKLKWQWKTNHLYKCVSLCFFHRTHGDFCCDFLFTGSHSKVDSPQFELIQAVFAWFSVPLPNLRFGGQ